MDSFAVGRHLVNELGLAGETDTLARWMAHHLAQIMHEADNAQGAAQALAKTKAAELILKLWRHRGSLPGRADPMAKYKACAAFLAELSYRAHFKPNSANWHGPAEAAAGDAVREVSLIASAVAALSGAGLSDPRLNPAVLNALEPEELELLAAVAEQRLAILKTASDGMTSVPDLGSKERGTGGTDETVVAQEATVEAKVNASIRSAAASASGRAIEALQRLRRLLTEDPQANNSAESQPTAKERDE